MFKLLCAAQCSVIESEGRVIALLNVCHSDLLFRGFRGCFVSNLSLSLVTTHNTLVGLGTCARVSSTRYSNMPNLKQSGAAFRSQQQKRKTENEQLGRAMKMFVTAAPVHPPTVQSTTSGHENVACENPVDGALGCDANPRLTAAGPIPEHEHARPAPQAQSTGPFENHGDAAVAEALRATSTSNNTTSGETTRMSDLGSLVSSKLELKTLAPEEKLRLYRTPGPQIEPETVLTQKIVRGGITKTLKFQADWLRRFPWLCYSNVLQGGWCKTCVLFPPEGCFRRDRVPSVLVSVPFTRLERATGKDGYLNLHENMEYHMDCLQRAQAFVSSMMNPDKTLPVIISKQNEELFNKNRHILQCVVDAVILCGTRSLALRGHRDDWTSTSDNKGNFIALLELLSTYDDQLAKHLRQGSKNAMMTSKTVQNEIIDVIRTLLQEKIVREVGDAPFAIIADEARDSFSKKEYLSLCLRYVNAEKEIKEVVFDFKELERTNAEEISNEILKSLKDAGLDLSRLRGQAYDGASVMSAPNGVRGRIQQVASLALYVHCWSHRLNLSLVSGCDIAEVRIVFNVLNDVHNFFDPPKRSSFFQAIISMQPDETTQKRLKPLCKTRWVERHTAFEVFRELFEVVIQALDAISHPEQYDLTKQDWSWDAETLTHANGLLARLATADFLVGFSAARVVLGVIRPVTVKLQQREVDIVGAYSLVAGVIDRLEEMRTDLDEEFRHVFEDASTLGQYAGLDELRPPRVARRQVHRANAPSVSPIQHYRINIAAPLLDRVIGEMRNRFPAEATKALSAIVRLCPSTSTLECSEPDIESWQEELLRWSCDMPYPSSLGTELREFRRFWSSTTENLPTTLRETMIRTDGDSFPNVSRLLRVACTLPVTSVESERSFSAMRRTFNFLRSTCGEDRRAGLLLMNVHGKLAIDRNEVIRRFILLHKRRLFQ
jgi:hypothetical protein